MVTKLEQQILLRNVEACGAYNAMMDLQALTIHPQRFVMPKRVRPAPVWADRAKRYSLGTVWETRRNGK